MHNREICLKADGISKPFGAHYALQNISFTLSQGEVLCILGAQNAGKTTLMRILAGMIRPDSGAIELYGRRMCPYELHTAQKNGVYCLQRRQFLVQDMTVAENILAPSLIRGPASLTGLQCVHIRDILHFLHADLDIQTYPALLSPLEHQIIQLARAIAVEAKILLVDDIARDFTGSQHQQLLQILRRLADEGMSIIYFTDQIEDALGISNRLCVLYEGQQVSDSGNYRKDQLAEAMAGRTDDTAPGALRACDILDDGVHSMSARCSRSEQNLMAYLRAATEYINRHLSEELTPGAVAGAVHLSSGYLMMLFKSHLNISIMEYVYKKRIETAKIRLQSDTCKISDVAADVGIPNAQYFSVLFKKHTGMTPKEYRRVRRSLQDEEDAIISGEKR